MLPLVTFRQFLNDLRRQKLRSIMTMFGIFWGACSIVLLFAFGKGITEAQLKSFRGMGENIALFWPGITSKNYAGMPKGRKITPTEDDVVLIKQKAKLISMVSPEYSRYDTNIKYKKQSTLRTVVGVWPEYGIMRNVTPELGSRFLNERDLVENRRVIFIGNLLKEDLFGEDDAVGKEILLNGMPFKVIGVMKVKEQDSSYNGRDSRKGYIPSTTFKTMYSVRQIEDFVVQSKPTTTMEFARQEIYNILGSKYKFDPSDKEALSVWDTTIFFSFFKTFFIAFSGFLVGIGVATLITGAIGVSNIMNVVLEERTKEIGIKMALGARKSYIMWQFVIETLLITGIGGLLGFLFAWGIITIVPMFGLEDSIGVPSLNVWGGAAVIFILGIVGLVSGYFPARRAANLQPVQALKLF